tara:strand:+ start:26826 stop:26999 length:174 start_codon:yes stop_codon:yes gene_type:complete
MSLKRYLSQIRAASFIALSRFGKTHHLVPLTSSTAFFNLFAKKYSSLLDSIYEKNIY